MAFLVSPGVNTSEIDLTTSVPAVGTSTGATVGFFRWGPASVVTQVSNEVELAEKFFKPDNNSAASFMSAANFLAYGNDLRVVRVVNNETGAGASNNAVSNANSYLTITNDEAYFSNQYQTSNASIAWAARYPGSLGNSLKVSVCANTADFANWIYAPYFDSAPNTSTYALSVTNNSVIKDELHMVVVDEDGVISGVANTVLERYSNLSKASDAKGDDGATIYYKEILYRNSLWVHWLGHAAGSNATNAWGQTVATVNATGDKFHAPAVATYSMVNGADGSVTASNMTSAVNLFNNTEKLDISLLFEQSK